MKCLFCNKKQLRILKDFKNQPRCFDYQKNLTQKILKHRFVLLQCNRCAVIQLKKIGNTKSFLPKYEWIKNKEPNKHYIKLANAIEKIKNKESKILFISEFDNIIFNYFKKKNGKKIRILKNSDLKIKKKNPSQFLVQHQINKLNLNKIKKKYGLFDLIISCRVLEHSYNIYKFVHKLKKLLKDNGKMIFEVPDSRKSLSQGDVGMLWEEHSVYLTKRSIKMAFGNLGLSVKKIIKYNYPQEDALAIFLEKCRLQKSKIKNLNEELKIGKEFIKKLNKTKAKIGKDIIKLSNGSKNTVIFGAGHRTSIFINILNISKYIFGVIDDDKNKTGLYIPGTKIKIQNSKIINNKNINLCLLSLNIEIEGKIINNLKKINKKLKFFSIAPDSKFSLPIYRN